MAGMAGMALGCPHKDRCEPLALHLNSLRQLPRGPRFATTICPFIDGLSIINHPAGGKPPYSLKDIDGL